jgi:hypothetical protein
MLRRQMPVPRAAVAMTKTTDRRPTEAPPYRWRPGNGPDAGVLDRLARTFTRPPKPMGEAWFMGDERRMFTELMTMDVADAPTILLGQVLQEMSTGPSCFGPHEEWRAWYPYLLPRVVPLALSRPATWLIDDLLTATISQFPDGLPDRGPLAARDIVDTLGQALMEASRWRDAAMVGRDGDDWEWGRASGELSPFMLLVLKYLPEAQIANWTASLFDVADPRWRALLLAWLARARVLFGDEDVQPADVQRLAPDIDWAGASILAGHYSGDFREPVTRVAFLRPANKREFRRCVAQALAARPLAQWRSMLDTTDDFGVDLGDVAAAAMQAWSD